MIRRLTSALPGGRPALALLAAGVAGVLAGCTDASTSPAPRATPQASRGTEAPLLAAATPAGIIPGRYIVVLRTDVPDVASATRALAEAADAEVSHTYAAALKGFAGAMSAEAAAALAKDPRVKYVVPDGIATIDQTQAPVTWGLDRIDQRALPLSASYTYTSSRNEVHAYVLDSGILTGHVDFAGPNGSRATGDYDSVTPGGTGEDCNGHGTHVAGTIGGTQWGVAKQVRLHAVRVLDCGGNGSWSGIIAGMDWVTANHVKPAVANMSLGGGFNQAVNDAAAAMSNAGVFLAVSGGNVNNDSCLRSPASAPEATTTGATTNTDARASFSNFGPCVDIYAPGASITSAWWTSPTATSTISGTSMAAPHVAGVAALYKARRGDAAQPVIQNWMIANATREVITGLPPNTINALLYSPF